MRKFGLLIIAVLLLLPITVWADKVSEQEALQLAKTFLAKRKGSQTASSADGKTAKKKAPSRNLSKLPLKEGAESEAYYIFNVEDSGGFVIVSGDDRTEAILGYSDSGHISDEAMPDGLRYMLDGYAEQFDWLEESAGSQYASNRKGSLPSRGDLEGSSPTRHSIQPMIATRWDQGAPYNAYCPTIDEEKTVTGCVATAMAQILYYYKWPTEACSAIPGYTTTTKDKNKASYNLSLDGIEGTTFDWSSMTSTYTSSSTGAAADAVATLMQYCGWSLRMKYGLSENGGSSAYNECIGEALKAYFGYDGGVRNTYRKNYSYLEWVTLIYSELASGRPVALGGQSADSGHSFVCDGYDTDDYFHINWGWSGRSDGYFRLSALNPYDQGIGGSSTLDGFSFSQGAIIGIQPPVTGNADYCLSLERFNLGSPDVNATSKTYTRDGETGAFSGINLQYLLYNYKLGSYTIDYAVQMFNESGEFVYSLFESSYTFPDFNKNKNETRTDLSIPNTVADGTYYIRVMSRPEGSDTWQECYDGDRYQMTAVISGDELTINVPIPATVLPASATLAISGDSEAEGYLTQGYEQEVTAHITGGAVDYHGNVILCVNGYVVMGKELDVPAGQTVDAHFSYIPTTAGEQTLSLYSSSSTNKEGKHIGAGTQIGSQTVTITASDATNTQELTMTYEIANLDAVSGKLYGNALRVTATVNNPSADNSFASHLNCSLRKYESAEADIDDYTSATLLQKNITIARSGSTDVTFEYTGLELGKYYCLRFTYSQGYEEGGDMKTRTQQLLFSSRYQMGEGYLAYNDDGTNTICPTAAVIDAGSALCLDLTSLSTVPTVTPSSNPNCLYLLAEDADVPAGLNACNVVKGSAAANITLQDGYEFFTPVAFTADDITYQRTFTLPAGGNSGWNSICLPFAVSEVRVDDGSVSGKIVDWFHSSADTGKNFWLKTFTGDASEHVYFDYVTENTMTANTPYIIAVPGDTWGDEWQMTGKNVRFIGENAHIEPTATASVSGNNFKFCGSTVKTCPTDVYALNSDGSAFTKQSFSAGSPLPPFRAWIEGTSISSLSMPALSISSGLPTLIEEIHNAQCIMHNGAGAVYDLAGRRINSQFIMHNAQLPKPGVCIINRKLIIVK
ncbi:MAG: C10 family peptidase [Bacteroidaceae bacterium]|nr:C10 family peptidase [Bacteroidaceae bacterium]